MPDASAIAAALDERFGLAGIVRFEAGQGGLVRAAITAPEASAEVYLHGGQVTGFRPAGHEPMLFLSPQSRFAAGAAIRGGVPVVFPWFGARAGHLGSPDHGFARTSAWTVESVERAGDCTTLVLALATSAATRALWPHDAVLRERVVVGRDLSVALEVESAGGCTFEAALHTYLHVGDVRRASVTGLEGLPFVDKADGMATRTLGARPFSPSGETDRVFVHAPDRCTVTDPVLGRRLVIDKAGAAGIVVWNPWADKAEKMTDLGAGHWPAMLCVETANVAGAAIQLAPGARHAMGMTLSVAPV